MTLLLTEVASRVPFPLFVLPAGWWNGPVFVGDVRSVQGAVRAVQLYYLSPNGDHGFVLSHLAPAEAEAGDPLRLNDHLASFVSHLDPRYLQQRTRRAKGQAFTLKDFSHRDEIASIAGHPTAVRMLSHRTLTLRAARTAIVSNGRAVDLCLAGWRQLVEDALLALVPLTAEHARRFDLDAAAHGA